MEEEAVEEEEEHLLPPSPSCTLGGCCLRADPRQGCSHGSGQAPGPAVVSQARDVQEMRRHIPQS